MTGGPGGAPHEPRWPAMLRASVEQLASPLDSLGGWIELLEARAGQDPDVRAAVGHMGAEVRRLEQLAGRLDRLAGGSERVAVDPARLVDEVAGYYRARVLSLAHRFQITVEPSTRRGPVDADAVLLTWVVELLVQQALDALAGRGGQVTLSVVATATGGCRIRVEDDRPRGAGGSNASAAGDEGAGGPLGLAGRLAADHAVGRLDRVPVDQGAVFDVIIP